MSVTERKPSEAQITTALPILLVVDDEVRSQETLRRVLSEEFDVLSASTAKEAESILETAMVHAILCDQRMPDVTGVEFLKTVRGRWPDPVRMIISGYTDSEDIIAGVNEAGIYQYITKPWEPDNLLRTVRGALQLWRLQRENQSASVEMKQATEPLQRELDRKKQVLRSRYGFDSIVHAANSPMAEVVDIARRIAQYDISVLITGESGTGKELIARSIHYSSPRAANNFVVENCGALPDELLESELFGCKKGAFTGAYEDRIGLFEKANGGTVFLDEVGETSPAFQVKLLRVLQEGEIRPLGSQITRKINVRLISATNRDLEADVRAGRFRQDLFYRLSAFPVHLPPLRDRPMDVPLLANLLLGETMRLFGRPVTGFSDGALATMRAYPWPGNVRELQNEIQRMIATSKTDLLDEQVLSARVLNPEFYRDLAKDLPVSQPQVGVPLKQQVEKLEIRILESAMERHHGNISRASEELGLSRVGLRGKLQRYGLIESDTSE